MDAATPVKRQWAFLLQCGEPVPTCRERAAESSRLDAVFDAGIAQTRGPPRPCNFFLALAPSVTYYAAVP